MLTVRAYLYVVNLSQISFHFPALKPSVAFGQAFDQPFINYLTLGQALCPLLLMRMEIPVLSTSGNCCENHMGNFERYVLASSA